MQYWAKVLVVGPIFHRRWTNVFAWKRYDRRVRHVDLTLLRASWSVTNAVFSINEVLRRPDASNRVSGRDLYRWLCLAPLEREWERWVSPGSALSARGGLYTSKSDVCRRQILTYKDCPRTERIRIFVMVVDRWHRYSNESERAN